MNAFANAPSDSFVLLHLAGRRFALPANIVAELAPPVRLHAFPHTSPLLTGVIVRRGRIVPVFDAERALYGKSSLAYRFYLIARHESGDGAELGAIPVDGECELVAGFPETAPADQPSYIRGEIPVGGQSVAVLDLSALLHAQVAGVRSTEAAPVPHESNAAIPEVRHP